MAKASRRGRSNARNGRMNRAERRASIRDSRAKDRNYAKPTSSYGSKDHVREHNAIHFEPLTENQRIFFEAINTYTLVFGTGYMGTGKTHVALKAACAKLVRGEIKRIVFTRPDFEIDERLGTLPGDEQEKTAILFRVARGEVRKILGAGRASVFEADGRIIYAPLGSILGETYDDAMMIMDESQNTTPGQMFAFITRLGLRSNIVLLGDYRQQTFVSGRNGLKDALTRLGRKPGVFEVNFQLDDIVRNDFGKIVVQAYLDDESSKSEVDDSTHLTQFLKQAKIQPADV